MKNSLKLHKISRLQKRWLYCCEISRNYPAEVDKTVIVVSYMIYYPPGLPRNYLFWNLGILSYDINAVVMFQEWFMY